MIRPMIFLVLLLGVVIDAYPEHSEHLEHIPVHEYNPKIQFLGQHVDLHEVPTKVIRITKTVAIKVPVPYPVKIPHNVPYPVHVNKPYPVPVPQIIKVPQPIPVHVLSSGGGSHGLSLGHLDNSLDSGSTSHYQSPLSSYNVEESGHDTSGSDVSGYAGQYDGSEQYGESKQVPSSAVVFTSSSAYQPTQEAADTYQQSPQLYQKLSQETYTQNAEPTSENQRIDSRSYRHVSNPVYRQSKKYYQVRVPVHYMQQGRGQGGERYHQ